jgi:ABC-type lipopolysaccharide export system ATPase subunit
LVCHGLERLRQFIHCAKGTIELTSSKGERFEVGIAVTTTTRLATFLVDEKFVGVNIRVVRDFLDVRRGVEGTEEAVN